MWAGTRGRKQELVGGPGEIHVRRAWPGEAETGITCYGRSCLWAGSVRGVAREETGTGDTCYRKAVCGRGQGEGVARGGGDRAESRTEARGLEEDWEKGRV